MQIGSREHFTKIYNDLKSKQILAPKDLRLLAAVSFFFIPPTVEEWLDECPTNVETEFENGKYYIIRVDKRVEDTE